MFPDMSLDDRIDILTIFSVVLQVINYLQDQKLTNDDIVKVLNNQTSQIADEVQKQTIKIMNELRTDFKILENRLIYIEKRLEKLERL